MALMLELLDDWRLERGFLFRRPAFAVAFYPITPHRRQHIGRLFTAHY